MRRSLRSALHVRRLLVLMLLAVPLRLYAQDPGGHTPKKDASSTPTPAPGREGRKRPAKVPVPERSLARSGWLAPSGQVEPAVRGPR